MNKPSIIDTAALKDKLQEYATKVGRISVLKTEDIHPPKTGISVHFSGSLV